MSRLDAMLERLPPPWRIESGSRLHELLSLTSLWLETFDEDMDRVQRSHWIDTAFDRRDLEKLGALFEIAALPWEPDDLYRERLKATIAARLRGAVTPEVLGEVLDRILRAADDALLRRPIRERGQARLRLVEFPRQRCVSAELRARSGLLAPLDQVVLEHRGLEPSALEGAICGLTRRRSVMPTLINLANGDVVSWTGRVPAGAVLRLIVDPAADGEGPDRLRAELDGVDVSERLMTGRGFDPEGALRGESGLPLEVLDTPAPIRLERGANPLWFVPIGRFDEPGFDQAVYSLARPEVRQARFAASPTQAGPGEASFGQALFFQDPAVALDLWWYERRPARFDVELGDAGERHEAGARAHPKRDRERLHELLAGTVALLRAAGVDGRLRAQTLRETSPCHDRVTILRPDQGIEVSEQESRLDALGALFDTTAKDGARFE